jgi:hypothetical protein
MLTRRSSMVRYLTTCEFPPVPYPSWLCTSPQDCYQIAKGFAAIVYDSKVNVETYSSKHERGHTQASLQISYRMGYS